MSDTRDVLKVLTAQAFALDRIFFRAAKGAVSGHPHSLYDARKALTAQARCRATFKILLALRAAAGVAKKFADSSERTIQAPKTPCEVNSLPKAASLAPAPLSSRAQAPGRRLVGRTPALGAGWSPERRARQALAIHTWRPWRKSSGPRTQGGKLRSAKNALKHGCRSRPYIQSRREDRRVLRLSAANIAAGRVFLRGLPARRSAGSEGVSPNWYWPSAARAGTVFPHICPGIARTRGPAGAPGGSS